MSKRPAQEAGALTKRARVEEDGDADSNTQQLVIGQAGTGKGLIRSVKRTSALQAPICLLQGHTVRSTLVRVWLHIKLRIKGHLHRRKFWMQDLILLESI